MMKQQTPKTLDEILFENRNKEYGSYWLRKRYIARLSVSFIISLFLVTLLTLAYFWYLNYDGGETVYYLPGTGAGTKSTQVSLLTQNELSSLMSAPVEDITRQGIQADPEIDELHDFQLGDTDTKPEQDKKHDDLNDTRTTGYAGPDMLNDSTVFGGYILGNGEGSGFGNALDRYPEFPGGPEGVRKYVELTVFYPAIAIKQKIHGVVLVSFDVNKQGLVDNIRVERSIDPILDVEAVKAIKKMPPWKPGMRHGKPVIVKFLIPVNFMPIN
jgi:TonB family protein